MNILRGFRLADPQLNQTPELCFAEPARPPNNGGNPSKGAKGNVAFIHNNRRTSVQTRLVKKKTHTASININAGWSGAEFELVWSSAERGQKPRAYVTIHSSSSVLPPFKRRSVKEADLGLMRLSSPYVTVTFSITSPSLRRPSSFRLPTA